MDVEPGRKKLVFFAIAAVLVGFGCVKKPDLMPLPVVENPVFESSGRAGDPLAAGFAKEPITPKGPVFLGGFGPMRISTGAHDDIFVRSLVLLQGKEKLALVSVDVVGLQRTDVQAMKARVKGFRPEQIIIASTHTHSGPDTLGLWGVPPFISGRRQKYIDRIGEAVARTVEQAEREAVEATAYTAAGRLKEGVMVNLNQGEPVDNAFGVMQFKDRGGKTLATLMNVNGHPEAMWDDNHKITADYPGRVCELAEEAYGGGAIFFSADLGAMMSPARPGPGEDHDFERMERIAQSVFSDLSRAAGSMTEERDPVLAHRMSRLLVPVENDLFRKLVEIGILERELYEGDRILTQVHVFEIGSAQFVAFPGEVYPKMGLKVRAMQKPHSFQIGLADDELGYILYPGDYGAELYQYETSMCTGPETALMVEDALSALLDGGERD